MVNLNKHISTFKNYLSYADLFGQKIDLTYNQEIYYRTYYGAIFTIFIFLFLIIQAIAGYKELTTRLNPIINTLEVEEEKVPMIDLKKENITIAIGFASNNRSEYLYDQKFFEIESKYVSKSKNDSNDLTMTKPLNLEKCQSIDFHDFQKIFDNFSLNNALCIKPTNLTQFELFSKPEEFQENYIKLNFKFCTESKSKICKPPEEIMSRFNYLNIYVYIVHDYFDAMDIKQPIKRRLSMIKWNFDDYEIKRKDSVYLTQHSLRDYNNLIMTLSEPESKNFVAYTEKNILRNFKFGRVAPISGSNKFMELYFKAHYIPVKITRKYNTFIDLLGNLGGLFNVFFIVGNLIFGYVDRTLLDSKMINDHFNIVDNKQYQIATIRRDRNNKDYFKNIFKNKNDFPDEVNKNHNKQGTIVNDVNMLNNKDELFIPKFGQNNFDMNYSNQYSIRNFSYKSSLNGNKNSFRPFKPYNETHELDSSNDIQNTKSNEKNKQFLTMQHISENEINHKFKFIYNLNDIIFSLFCIQKRSLKKKNEIFENCKKLIDNYLDIKNLIALTQEFKVVRSMLFDKIQLSLINFYKKPIIKINEENQNKTILIYRKSIYDYEDKDKIKEEKIDGQGELLKIKRKLDIIIDRQNERKDKIDQKIIELTEL